MRDTSSFEQSVNKAAAAREKHFPRHQQIASAAALVTGVGLLVASMALPRQRILAGTDTLALADICYMAGFILVVLEVLYLAWVGLHLPAAPAREVHERSDERAPVDRKDNP